MDQESPKPVKCPFCGAPQRKYTGPWNAEVKCEYCGSVFWVRREQEIQDDQQDMAAKVVAFQDSISGTGGEDRYPERSDGGSKIKDLYYLRAAAGMAATGLLGTVFVLLSVSAVFSHQFAGSLAFILVSASFFVVFYVLYRMLPKDERTYDIPESEQD